MTHYKANKPLKLIRNRNRVSELIRQLNQAKQANLAKSFFLSEVSHDLRAPMNSILGMVSLANLYLDNPQRIKDCLNKITQASQQLLQLVDEVLDISQIEVGKTELKEQNFYLDDLLEELQIIFSHQAPQLQINNRTGGNPLLKSDKIKIQRILSNILSNACKFTPPEGQIELSVQSLGQLGTEREIFKFKIKDSGMGIKSEFLDKIFQPFTGQFQEDSPAGHGLGMAIVRQLVEFLEGDINIASQPGEGTTVTVILSLPISREEATYYQKEEESLSLAEETTIYQIAKKLLLVDDNTVNLEIASEFLQLSGFQVDIAFNGAEAVEKIRNSPEYYYDLILMDIKMPIMNGYEATQAIRQLERSDTSLIPIIAMTANAFKHDQHQTNQAGMALHLSKPIDFTKLPSILQEILDKST